MQVQRITTPSGDDMVVLSARDFAALIDARDHAVAMAAHERGADEGVTGAEMDATLAAVTPLAQPENGERKGGLITFRALARALRAPIEDRLPGG